MPTIRQASGDRFLVGGAILLRSLRWSWTHDDKSHDDDEGQHAEYDHEAESVLVVSQYDVVLRYRRPPKRSRVVASREVPRHQC